ncbi:hypothetical protein AB0B86_28115 [Micromonospora sp. NPDC049047]|uniref:hypothetical protein n=1 Tax=Micromonospora sp. NPDC049047 TaxID=3155645 RepID=UPI0034072E03
MLTSAAALLAVATGVAAAIWLWPSERGFGLVLDRGDQVASIVGALAALIVGYLTLRRSASSKPIAERSEPPLAKPDVLDRWHFGGLSAAGHFLRAGQGRRGMTVAADLFRGREDVIAAVLAWLDSTEESGRPFVISGPPGTGKSAVLARVAMRRNTVLAGNGLMFLAAGARVSDLDRAMREWLGLPSAASDEELLERLGDESRIVLADALDEAATPRDAVALGQALSRLATIPSVRVVVATRPWSAGPTDRRRYGWDALLPQLGITAVDQDGLIDLAVDFADPEGVRQYALAILTQPDLSGGVRRRCRADPELAQSLAAEIAERAAGNFLIAGLAAERVARSNDVKPHSFEFPTDVAQALLGYLGRRSGEESHRLRIMMTTLAHAQGAGVDDELWLRFATALGLGDAGHRDLKLVHDSAAVDLIVGVAEPDSRPRHRLFHHALADVLLAGRDSRADNRALYEACVTVASRDGWDTDYVRRFVAGHAARGGSMDDLLDRVDFLVTADPQDLLPHLDSACEATGKRVAAAYRLASDRLVARDRIGNAGHLEVAAAIAHLPVLRKRIANAVPRAQHVRWAKIDPAMSASTLGQQTLRGHDGEITTLATGESSDGIPLLVSGGRDGTARLWRLDDGRPLMTLAGPGTATCVAIAALSDGSKVVVAGNDDPGTAERLSVWRLKDGELLYRINTPQMRAVVATTMPDGTPVLVGGGSDRTLYVWRVDDGELLTQWATAWPIGSVETVRMAGAGDVVVAGAGNGIGAAPELAAWRLADLMPVDIPAPHFGGSSMDPRNLSAISAGDGSTLFACAVSWTLAVWRHGSSEAIWSTGRAGPTTAIGSLPDQTTIVLTGGAIDDPVVHVRSLDDGRLLYALTGPSRGISAVAAGSLAHGTTVAVGAYYDGSIRLWRLDDAAPAEETTGHLFDAYGATIMSATLGDGTDVVLSSGGRTPAVRVWRLDDGAELRTYPAPYRPSFVTSSTLADGRSVIVRTAKKPGNMLSFLWTDPPLVITDVDQDHVLYHFSPPLHPGFSAAALDVWGDVNALVTVTAKEARVWRLDEGTPYGEPLAHGETINKLTTGTLADGTPVVMTAGGGLIKVWRLGDTTPVREFGYDGSVFAIASHGSKLAAGGSEKRVWVWDIDTGESLACPLTHDGWVASVSMAHLADGAPAVVSGGYDGVVRVWATDDQHGVETHELRAGVGDALLVNSSILVVATTYGIIAQTTSASRHGRISED